jgi:sulfoxide reductase heme-binding subunit YedZ
LDPTRLRRSLQAAALGLVLAPLALLGLRAAGLAGDLGANPVEEVLHTTGDWALRCLLACLAVTPVRRLTRIAALAPLRRTLGLAAFGWASLHLLAYAGLDQGFDARALLEDVRERRYVFAGLTAFLCLVPLAATSTRAAQRRLGRRWKTLHLLVFVAAAAALVHFAWLVKADLLAPLAHAAAFALLVGLRLVPSRTWGSGRRSRRSSSRRPSPSTPRCATTTSSTTTTCRSSSGTRTSAPARRARRSPAPSGLR